MLAPDKRVKINSLLSEAEDLGKALCVARDNGRLRIPETVQEIAQLSGVSASRNAVQRFNSLRQPAIQNYMRGLAASLVLAGKQEIAEGMIRELFDQLIQGDDY